MDKEQIDDLLHKLDVFASNKDIHCGLPMWEMAEMREIVRKALNVPLEFPAIDLGMIPGDGPKHPFESFEYTERN